MSRAAWLAAALTAACAVALAPVSAQMRESVFDALQHPAIQYDSADTGDAVTRLNAQLAAGEVRIAGQSPTDVVRSILAAFAIPVESQLLVFSRTGIQAPRTTRKNPRMLFFNDSTIAGWVRGGFIEVATHSPKHGATFYALAQDQGGRPTFVRREECIRCHHSYSTLGVPGMLVRSVFTGSDGFPLRELGDFVTTDRSPFEERWGGWFVTGKHGTLRHMGNGLVLDPSKPGEMVSAGTLNLASVADIVDPEATLTPHSDIVSLLVFQHQMQMANLITRIGFETRAALHDRRPPEIPLADMAREVVDGLLFVDEVPLPDRVQGTSGFAEVFAARGPRDPAGRSLRELDLSRRLMKYPCSYTIYSEAFDALPAEAKDAIHARLWDVLSGREQGARYARLSSDDRQAIVEILRATKKDLPQAFAARPR